MGGKASPQRVVTAIATGGASEVAKKVQDSLAPDMPGAQDTNGQRAQAEADVNAAQLKDINLKNSGLASTILGGSVGTDDNLKKKKLLGE